MAEVWSPNNIFEGVLKYPSTLVSNNPEDYGIIFADDISGHRTVPDIDTLFIIPTAILSKSGINENNDAIGQLWYVRSEEIHYKLIDWENRHNEDGWEEFRSGFASDAQKILAFGTLDKAVSFNNFLDVNGNKIRTDSGRYFLVNDTNTLLPDDIKNFEFNILSEEDTFFQILFGKSFICEQREDRLVIDHKNIVTAKTIAGIGKIAYDENGHITDFVEYSASDSASILNVLSVNNNTPTDTEYYISGNTRKQHSALWTYIKGKSDATYAPKSHDHSRITASYSGNGGQQGPNYFGNGFLGAIMSNATINGNSNYKNWIYVNAYTGSDVGGTTAIGINRQTLGAYIMRAAANATAWAESAELIGTHNFANYHDYNTLKNKPTSFTPSSHTHTKSQITDFPSSLPASDVYAWAKASAKPSYAWSEITGKPSTFTPSSHSHAISDITNLQTTLNGKAATDHTHSGYAASSHSHSWDSITGKPSTFTPASHTHVAADLPSNVAYTNKANQVWTGYQNFTGGAGNSGSDMRFKKNIKHINKGILDKLMILDIISYNWCKQDEEERDTFGINGNQLKQLGGLFEKLIHYRNDEEKTLWVEYDRFGVLAIAGIKELERKRKSDKRQLLQKISEQQTEIEELQNENKTLFRKLKAIENRLNKLEPTLKKLGY